MDGSGKSLKSKEHGVVRKEVWNFSEEVGLVIDAGALHVCHRR